MIAAIPRRLAALVNSLQNQYFMKENCFLLTKLFENSIGHLHGTLILKLFQKTCTGYILQNQFQFVHSLHSTSSSKQCLDIFGVQFQGSSTVLFNCAVLFLQPKLYMKTFTKELYNVQANPCKFAIMHSNCCFSPAVHRLLLCSDRMSPGLIYCPQDKPL